MPFPRRVSLGARPDGRRCPVAEQGVSCGKILQRFPVTDWDDTAFIDGIELVSADSVSAAGAPARRVRDAPQVQPRGTVCGRVVFVMSRLWSRQW